MTLEEIYAKLKEIDGGADMADAVRKELTSLRNEAKENRLAKDEILKAIGAKNADEGKAQAEALTKLMGKLKEVNTNPDAMVTRLTSLEEQVTALTKASKDAQLAAEKAKKEQIASQKHSALIETLTAANAVKPSEIAKLRVIRGQLLTTAHRAAVPTHRKAKKGTNTPRMKSRTCPLKKLIRIGMTL